MELEQLIEDGVSGYLMKIDQPQELVESIRKINEMSEQEILQMVENAKKVTERFAPEEIYKKVMIFYESIIHKKTGREV